MQTEMTDAFEGLAGSMSDFESGADAQAERRERLVRTLATALRGYRQGTGESLRELARRVGVTAAHLHDIEHGRRFSAAVAEWLLNREEAPEVESAR